MSTVHLIEQYRRSCNQTCHTLPISLYYIHYTTSIDMQLFTLAYFVAILAAVSVLLAITAGTYNFDAMLVRKFCL